jgi:hypothetical protein
MDSFARPSRRWRAFANSSRTIWKSRLWLGQIYVMYRLPDRALEALRDPLEQPERFSLAKTNETQLNVIAAAAYFQKNDFAQGTQLLETEIALHPTDDDSAHSHRAGLSGPRPVHQRAHPR